jgi:hypothetical protein
VLKGDPLPRPYVVKPANEGSSVGVQIITKSSNARPFDGIEWPYGEFVLCEEFIQGRELTAGVMGDRAMAVTELKVDGGFYDYAHKYTDGVTVHLCPAPLREDIAQEAMRMALVAHQTLGCRGVSRCDFRYDDTNRRHQQAVSAGDQHPARHDRAVAGAGAGQALGISYRTGVLDGARRMRRLEAPAVKIARGRGNPVTSRTALPPRAAAAGVAALSIRFGIGFGACAAIGGGFRGVQSGWLEHQVGGERHDARVPRPSRPQPADRRKCTAAARPGRRTWSAPGARGAALLASTSMPCASAWPPCPGSSRRRWSGAIPTAWW